MTSWAVHGNRVPTRHSVAVAATAVALTLALAGCGTAGAGAPEGAPAGASTRDPTGPDFGWFAFGGTATGGTATGATATGGTAVVDGEPGVPGPVDALERAGLHLPDHADVREVSTQASAGYAESYVFVFRVPAADAAGFCGRGGLGGARPVAAVPEAVADALGHPAVAAGSRWCAGAAPADPRWSRYAVIDAGSPGHPATVHLLLQRTP